MISQDICCTDFYLECITIPLRWYTLLIAFGCSKTMVWYSLVFVTPATGSIIYNTTPPTKVISETRKGQDDKTERSDEHTGWKHTSRYKKSHKKKTRAGPNISILTGC